jgi:hypothetical protein
MCRGHAGRIAGPAFRQIQAPIDEAMAVARHVRGEDANLTIGDLACRSGVLPCYPTGRLSLLEKAGLIEDQHRVRIGKRFDDIVAHDIA